MVFSRKYCPIWVYDCVVSQTVSDFILYGVDLTQPCRKFAGGLTELFEEVSLEELVRASELVGKVLKMNDIVIYESTVFPGATEEECVPILEKISGLTFNKDFFAGYSPERINPGDTIVVPLNTEPQDFDITSFIADLSTTLANIAAILLIVDNQTD